MSTRSCDTLLHALLSRGRALRNLVVVLLVWGAKEAISELFFHCPCFSVTRGAPVPPWRIAYGSLFIAVPAFLLWLLGIMMVEQTWRCMIGCAHKPRPLLTSACACFWGVFGRSALAPITWIVLVFIDGRYLDCILASTPVSCVKANNATILQGSVPQIQTASEDIHALSAVIGCSIAGSAILVYFMVVLACNCFNKSSYYQRIYSDELHRLEVEALKETGREHMLPYYLAKWRALIQTGSQESWAEASSLPMTSPEDTSEGTIYTPFQAMSVGGFSETPRMTSKVNGVKDERKGRQSLSVPPSGDSKRPLPSIATQEVNPSANVQTLEGSDVHSGLGDIVDERRGSQYKKKRRKSKKVAISPRAPEGDL